MNENSGASETNNCPEYNPSVLAVKPPNTIAKFVDELPIPPVLTPLSQGEDSAYYELR
jgi:hypothetical protein